MSNPSQNDLQIIFSAVDKDGSGLIDATELQAALGQGGVVLSLASVAQLIRLHDRNHNGKIDFSEFTTLHQFLSDAQSMFVAVAGTAPAATLSTDQLRTVLGRAGYGFLEPPAFAAVCTAFDPERSNRYDLTRFYAMMAFLKAGVATYRGFDVRGSGSVTMSMNQFLYAAANTR
jgi:hypothetical protein